MQPKLTIQERLKDLRVERSLTLEQLSAETGISKSALGKYEADDFKDISPFSINRWKSLWQINSDSSRWLNLPVLNTSIASSPKSRASSSVFG